MNGNNRTLFLAGLLAAALAGCSDDTKLDERIVDGETPAAQEETITVFDPLSRNYTLRPEQQTRRDAFDPDEFQKEYARNREAILAAGNPSDQATGGATPSPGTGGESAASPTQGATGSGASGLRPRSDMDFAYLDRNSDGKLSVAEYAIWAIPIDPNQPKPNDGNKPYVTADQANRAADSYFFYDSNGDGWLQAGEFAVFSASR